MEKFKGIITALATPFDNDGKLNESALEKLIEYNIDMGVSGFFVCGSSAEVFYLSKEERKEIMELTHRYTKGRVTLIAHVGAISTQETIELSQFAENLGYDAVSSVAPFYHKLKFCEIEKYFNDIIKAVNIPLIIYNIPLLTNVHFTSNELCTLLKNDKIIGIKHTSNDYYQLRQLKTEYPQKIIYNGFDETFMAGLVMGADGAIGSNFNFMADKFVKIYNLFNENKIREAMLEQENATKIITVIYKYGLSQSIKAILKSKGIDCGVCRAPLGALSEDDEKNLLSELSDLL